MIYIYSKTPVRFRYSSVLYSTIHKLYVLQTHRLYSSLKSISTSTNQHSFTVNYLINSCGLSPETAISASKCINFKTLDKPDSVLNFFKSHGFSETQISTLLRKRPKLFLSDLKKTILPKFEFFYSSGISNTELAKIVSTNPTILGRSLKNKIIPSFKFLKNLFHSDDKFISAFKRFPDVLGCCHSAITFRNIEILRQHGVPNSNIVYIFNVQPLLLVTKPDRFNELVEDVKKMGFNPSKVKFVIAVQALMSMRWKRRMEVYKKCGWSEGETMLAFIRFPSCMTISEEKIMAVLSFYVKTMGWESSLIAHCPSLMSYSLGKRIIPRCSVLQVLLLKGLIKKSISIVTLLVSTESYFLKKFVTCYEEAPQLLKLYQEKMDLSKLHGHDYEVLHNSPMDLGFSEEIS